MRKTNYATARKTMIFQAQKPSLLNVAKPQARQKIEDFFAIPLHVAGLPNVKVAASFE